MQFAYDLIRILVRIPGFTWKSLYPSLIHLSEKLEELGLIEINGQIVLLQDEEVNNV
ncbi:MAG: hypothetical protein ABSB12_01730 [Candidatus Saccharimonadales bacterium]|jgi:hypothetical protein